MKTSDVGTRFVDRLDAKLRREFPTTFAGITLDPPTIEVHAIPDAALARAVRVIQEQDRAPGPLRIVIAERSLLALEVLHERMKARVPDFPGVTGFGIDVRRNRLVVRVANGDEAIRGMIWREFGQDNVIIEKGQSFTPM